MSQNAIILEPAAMGGIAASSTASGYSASNIARDEMGLVWQSAPGTSHWISFDLGADTPIDTVTMHGLSGATQGWQWKVETATSAQGSFTGAYTPGALSALLAGTESPVSGLGRAFWQSPTGTVTARYVRITVSGTGGAAAEIARICVGKAFQPLYNMKFGASFGIKPLSRVDFSTRAAVLRRKGKRLRTVNLSFTAATKAEIEGTVLPMLERVSNDTPIVVITEPDAHAQRQRRIYYGFLVGDLGAVWAAPCDQWSTDINLFAID